ncbi:MAG: hypothetical protein MHM6MM_007000 [Cercozoa sp. M6MM]
MSKRPRRLRLQRVPFADTLDAEHTPSPRRLHVPISKADDPQRKRRRLHASFAKPVLTESPVVGQTQESHSKEKEGIQDCTPLPPPPLQPVPVRSVQRELKTPTVTPQRRDRMQLRVSLSDLADRQTECRRVRRERNFHVAMICLGKQCLDMPPPLSLKLCEPPTFDLSTDRQSVLPRNASEYRRHRDGPRRFAVDYAVTLRREQVCGAVSRRAARREMRLFSRCCRTSLLQSAETCCFNSLCVCTVRKLRRATLPCQSGGRADRGRRQASAKKPARRRTRRPRDPSCLYKCQALQP